MIQKITTYFLLFFLAFQYSYTQNIELELVVADSVDFPIKISKNNTFNTFQEVETELRKLLAKLQNEGYFTASVDSLYEQGGKMKAVVFLGEIYQWASVNKGNISPEIVKDKKLFAKTFDKKPINYKKLDALKLNILKAYQNNGYPFAEVYFDSIDVVDNHISGQIMVKPHKLFTIDSLSVEGNSKTKPLFVSNYLGIKTGDLYSEQKIKSISKKWAQLPYLKEVAPTEVKFVDENVRLKFNLAKQKSNQFYFILGLLPNNQLVDKKITITGEGKLFLQNSFGFGEEIEAEFRQIKSGTQKLDVAIKYPYIVNLPFGTYGAFQLFKNDTLFVDIKSEVGVLYQFGGANSFRAFYNNQTSNVLNYDTTSIKLNGNLPNTIDLRINKYGLGTKFQKFDYLLNPRQGYSLEVEGAVGLKTIKENNTLKNLISNDGESLENIYNDVPLKSIIYEVGFTSKNFVPFGKRSTVLFANQTKVLIAQNIFENQLFRIGGFRIMRGFDEQAIVSPFYIVNTLEYRFLLSKNSFFNTFVDVGIVENAIQGANSVDIPIGFGAGLSLETKGGIFSLSYALGKQLNNKIEFRNGKIHFGYVNLF